VNIRQEWNSYRLNFLVTVLGEDHAMLQKDLIGGGSEEVAT